MAVETETPTHGAPGGLAPAPGRRDAPRNSLWLAPAVLTVVPLAMLVALWLPARSWSARTGDARAGVTTLSGFSALAGTVLLATTIVLSARLRLLERRVGGLDRVYRLHHWLGGVAFTLVALHPVLLAWRNATTSWNRAAQLWWPTTGDWALAAGQLALYAMAVALTVTVFVRVRHQVLVWLQRILGAAFLVAAYHVLSVGGVVSSYRPLRWYMIGVLTAGTAALVYHSVLGRLLTRHHPYRVLAVVRRPGAVDELHLAPAGRPLHFVAGQFAFLRFRHGDISGEPHPFSMASAPSAGDLRFAVKELGDYTRHLHEVRPGADAVLEGPYGRFSYRFVAGHDQIWIAGGIGIAPFLAMAADLPRSGFEVELYYSFPDDDRAPFLDELATLEAANPTLHVHLSCDRRDGILTADAVAARSGSLDGREFLLCGPPAMIHALRSQLLARGVARQRVHFEEFEFG